jgi:hypothetical protein
MDHGQRSTSARHRIEFYVVQTEIYCPNLIKTKSYFCSNLDHSSKVQWPKLLLPYLADKNRGGNGMVPWPAVRELGFVLWCHSLWCDPFYATKMAQGIHFTHLWQRNWSTEGRRRRCGSGGLWRWWGPLLAVLQSQGCALKLPWSHL